MTDLEALHQALDEWTDLYKYDTRQPASDSMLVLLALVEDALLIKKENDDGT